MYIYVCMLHACMYVCIRNRRLRVFEKYLPRQILGPKRREEQNGAECSALK